MCHQELGAPNVCLCQEMACMCNNINSKRKTFYFFKGRNCGHTGTSSKQNPKCTTIHNDKKHYGSFL